MKKAMREEARAAIIEALRDGYTGYYCDLHNEVFNTDYYIIGTYEAKKALEEYGVFDAIEKVQTYEKDNFGEIYTDLSDPEKLINMLYYIIGEEVLYEMMDGIEAWEENWNNRAEEETNAEILKTIAEAGRQIGRKREQNTTAREFIESLETSVDLEKALFYLGQYTGKGNHYVSFPDANIPDDVDPIEFAEYLAEQD